MPWSCRSGQGRASIGLAPVAVGRAVGLILPLTGRHRLLGRAVLRGADLRGADLRYANLKGADLSRADLAGARIHEIRCNELTILPDGTYWSADVNLDRLV